MLVYLDTPPCGKCGKKPGIAPVGFHSYLCDQCLSELLKKCPAYGYRLVGE